jgi:hypothetical protein
MSDTTCELTDDLVVAALAVNASAPGAAALLSSWTERLVTADDVNRRIAASPRLQLVTEFCAQAQGRGVGSLTEDRIRAMAGPRRWQERRARK